MEENEDAYRKLRKKTNHKPKFKKGKPTKSQEIPNKNEGMVNRHRRILL